MRRLHRKPLRPFLDSLETRKKVVLTRMATYMGACKRRPHSCEQRESEVTTAWPSLPGLFMHPFIRNVHTQI